MDRRDRSAPGLPLVKSLPTLLHGLLNARHLLRVCKVPDSHFARKKTLKIYSAARAQKLFLEIHPKSKEFVGTQEMQLIGGCEYFDQ